MMNLVREEEEVVGLGQLLLQVLLTSVSHPWQVALNNLRVHLVVYLGFRLSSPALVGAVQHVLSHHEDYRLEVPQSLECPQCQLLE